MFHNADSVNQLTSLHQQAGSFSFKIRSWKENIFLKTWFFLNSSSEHEGCSSDITARKLKLKSRKFFADKQQLREEN